MSEQPVLFSHTDGVATLRLNRPQTLNAMNDPLMSGITGAVQQVVDDESIRVLVVTGEGRGFCAGADLAAMASGPEPDAANKPTTGQPSSAADGIFNTAMRALMSCPVPTIARVNGPAAGGGFGLALACDITIAAESAFFVATFGPRLGIVPDLGTTWSVPLRVGRARALGITLLGERISAKQAEEWRKRWRC
jgi:2-(1,2-epoxy-1,2-dihydrophenyl)acetyl-CoA isomerase